MKKLLVILLVIVLLIGYCAYKGLETVSSIVDTISDAPIKSEVKIKTQGYDFDGARKYLADNRVMLKSEDATDLSNYIDSLEKIYLDFRSKNLENAKKQLKVLHSERDDFESITWYRDKSSPKYTNSNGILAYFGLDDDFKVKSDIRWAIQYSDEDWIHFDRVGFNIDGERIDYKPVVVKTMVDDGGMILEYFDQVVSEEERSIIDKIIASDKATYRLFGTKGNVDKEITKTQKQAFSNVLAAYDLLSVAEFN